MNAVLLEMNKATLSAQVVRDNDTALTDQALSVFSAAQITGLLNLAIDSKATRCTALLLNYKYNGPRVKTSNEDLMVNVWL